MRGLRWHLRMARYWWHRYWTRIWYTRVRPSPMQREFNRGDPDGKVRAYSDRVLRELREEYPDEF